jgi:hypothetical protein
MAIYYFFIQAAKWIICLPIKAIACPVAVQQALATDRTAVLK